jgi:hypothetical protein
MCGHNGWLGICDPWQLNWDSDMRIEMPAIPARRYVRLPPTDVSFAPPGPPAFFLIMLADVTTQPQQERTGDGFGAALACNRDVDGTVAHLGKSDTGVRFGSAPRKQCKSLWQTPLATVRISTSREPA